MRRNKKKYNDDDGRVIADMNVDGLPWYNPSCNKKSIDEQDKLTKKEKRSLIKSGYLAYLPAFLSIIVGMGAAVMLIYLWLHGWSF